MLKKMMGVVLVVADYFLFGSVVDEAWTQLRSHHEKETADQTRPHLPHQLMTGVRTHQQGRRLPCHRPPPTDRQLHLLHQCPRRPHLHLHPHLHLRPEYPCFLAQIDVVAVAVVAAVAETVAVAVDKSAEPAALVSARVCLLLGEQ